MNKISQFQPENKNVKTVTLKLSRANSKQLFYNYIKKKLDEKKYRATLTLLPFQSIHYFYLCHLNVLQKEFHLL